MPGKSQSESRVLTRQDQVDPVGTRRSRTAPAHHVERSAIILHLADQRSASETASAFGIDRQRVTRCARRGGPRGSIGSLAAATFQASSPDTFKRVVTFLPMLRHLSMFKARQRSMVVGRGHLFYLRLAKAVAPPVAMLDRASQNCDRWLRQ